MRWDIAELPPPAEGEVVVQTQLSAVSVASELSVALGHSPAHYPCSLGYQTLGRVTAVGKGAALPLGTRVISTAGHVSASLQRAEALIQVPAHISDLSALAVILGEETHKGVRKLAPQPTERVLIAGAGLLGLLTLFNLTRRGVRNVTVIEPDADRRALAQAFGAQQTAEPSELTETEFDLGFECSAAPAGFTELLSRLRRDGRACILSDGNWGAFTLPPEFHGRELSVVASSDGENYHSYAEWLWAHPDLLLDRLFETRIEAEQLPETYQRLSSWPRPISLTVAWPQ
ncbi:theronine dehydrogenase [Deinococcus psychrotolerans]|uniref:theronine dehydrogenase n=1 Tax=Deinococcus psychrotolerans TaxID=2489213 RepID=UPI001F154EE6|nr:theronine dehydrogenase [Deinococcus psychrotolerans]